MWQQDEFDAKTEEAAAIEEHILELYDEEVGASLDQSFTPIYLGGWQKASARDTHRLRRRST